MSDRFTSFLCCFHLFVSLLRARRWEKVCDIWFEMAVLGVEDTKMNVARLYS